MSRSPDFLPCCTRQSACAPFREERRIEFANAIKCPDFLSASLTGLV
jgi:hypothetical protein